MSPAGNAEERLLIELGFARDLPSERKREFAACGPNTTVACPVEVTNPHCVYLGDWVRLHWGMRISVFQNISQVVGYLEDRFPHLSGSMDPRDYLFDDPLVEIGDATSIGRFGFITATNRVRVGQAVIISERVYISDTQHRFQHPEVPIIYQGLTGGGTVEIGDHSWVGVGATILDCRIGKHCVIGAHSLVVEDVPDYCVAAGSPARVIRRYDHARASWEPA